MEACLDEGAGTISLLVNKCNFVAVAVMFCDGSYIFFFFFLVTSPLLLVSTCDVEASFVFLGSLCCLGA